MEEQRARQVKDTQDPANNTTAQPPSAASAEEELLERALGTNTSSLNPELLGESTPTSVNPTPSGMDNFAAMSEDEQIAYAMRLSMENTAVSTDDNNTPAPMETDDSSAGAAAKTADQN